MKIAAMPPRHELAPPNGHLSQFIHDLFPEGYRGWAVDVGASDGISINSTYVLEKAHFWTVVSAEANPAFWPMLLANRSFVERCAVSNYSGEGTFYVNEDNPEAFSALTPPDYTRTYPSAGERYKQPTPGMQISKVRVPVKTVDEIIARWQFPRLDGLFIDTEGTEPDVLKGCDLKRWNPKVVVLECWDKMSTMDLYMESFGYKKTARNVHNDIWVRP